MIMHFGYKNILVNLDDAPKVENGHADLEICIMSARSAQRTRQRRWRMGRDIAGGLDNLDGSSSSSRTDHYPDY